MLVPTDYGLNPASLRTLAHAARYGLLPEQVAVPVIVTPRTLHGSAQHGVEWDGALTLRTTTELMAADPTTLCGCELRLENSRFDHVALALDSAAHALAWFALAHQALHPPIAADDTAGPIVDDPAWVALWAPAAAADLIADAPTITFPDRMLVARDDVLARLDHLVASAAPVAEREAALVDVCAAQLVHLAQTCGLDPSGAASDVIELLEMSSPLSPVLAVAARDVVPVALSGGHPMWRTWAVVPVARSGSDTLTSNDKLSLAMGALTASPEIAVERVTWPLGDAQQENFMTCDGPVRVVHLPALVLLLAEMVDRYYLTCPISNRTDLSTDAVHLAAGIAAGIATGYDDEIDWDHLLEATTQSHQSALSG